MLTEREQFIWSEIKQWENDLFSYEQNNVATVFDEWLEQSFLKLPEDIQEQFLQTVDEWLVHLQVLIQSSQMQKNAEKRILESARLFDSEIVEISDMNRLKIDQLQYIANEQILKHRLYSFVQGGLTGTGKALFAGIDVPALAVINIRIIQLIGLSYGYKLNNPFNMNVNLKCFHGGMLPKEWKKEAWNNLVHQLNDSEDHYFHGADDKITTLQWLQQPLKQLLKLIVISIFKNKKLQNLPLATMAIGAGMNYNLTKEITNFTHTYYKYRYLTDNRDI